eukprot:TRINITY_DN47376_c0_g1_i1.p1 TRINITY_DN47376_c0_g1~~TRINITY_DN47376_c0_g1_i1.p1  ORF type:complete len:292 (+),score=87.75 TRINITY_DN47376_c0_g1_i1:60-878(+)
MSVSSSAGRKKEKALPLRKKEELLALLDELECTNLKDETDCKAFEEADVAGLQPEELAKFEIAEDADEQVLRALEVEALQTDDMMELLMDCFAASMLEKQLESNGAADMQLQLQAVMKSLMLTESEEMRKISAELQALAADSDGCTSRTEDGAAAGASQAQGSGAVDVAASKESAPERAAPPVLLAPDILRTTSNRPIPAGQETNYILELLPKKAAAGSAKAFAESSVADKDTRIRDGREVCVTDDNCEDEDSLHWDEWGLDEDLEDYCIKW